MYVCHYYASSPHRRPPPGPPKYPMHVAQPQAAPPLIPRGLRGMPLAHSKHVTGPGVPSTGKPASLEPWSPGALEPTGMNCDSERMVQPALAAPPSRGHRRCQQQILGSPADHPCVGRRDQPWPFGCLLPVTLRCHCPGRTPPPPHAGLMRGPRRPAHLVLRILTSVTSPFALKCSRRRASVACFGRFLMHRREVAASAAATPPPPAAASCWRWPPCSSAAAWPGSAVAMATQPACEAGSGRRPPRLYPLFMSPLLGLEHSCVRACPVNRLAVVLISSSRIKLWWWPRQLVRRGRLQFVGARVLLQTSAWWCPA